MPRRKTEERDYTTVSIPMSLINRIDKYTKRDNAIYKSRVDFVLSSIRKELENLGLLETVRQPILEHFNLNGKGVRILDHAINLVVDVAFRPDGIWCSYCEADTCRHILFALTIPEIKDVIRKKTREGWRLPEV